MWFLFSRVSAIFLFMRFVFGNVQIAVVLPGSVQAETLPLYIQPFSGDVLPPLRAEARFSPLAEAPPENQPLPRRFGLPEGRFSRSGDFWHFWMPLPLGPCRPDILATHCVIPALFEILSAHGVEPVHASAVARSDRALLFIGRSGSGKSTMARALLACGYGFVSDDRVLLWRRGDELLAHTSFEQPNPFQRWTRLRPEADPPPQPLPPPPLGRAFSLGELWFVEVDAGAATAASPLSAAETAARLAVSGSGVLEPLGPLPVARRLTLGTGADTMIDQLFRR